MHKGARQQRRLLISVGSKDLKAIPLLQDGVCLMLHMHLSLPECMARTRKPCCSLTKEGRPLHSWQLKLHLPTIDLADEQDYHAGHKPDDSTHRHTKLSLTPNPHLPRHNRICQQERGCGVKAFDKDSNPLLLLSSTTLVEEDDSC